MQLDVEGALGALGLSLKNVAAGAVASFVSLRFFDGRDRWERWTTFVGGWALSAWGGPPLAAYLELGPKVEVGIVLVMGLFGMAVAAELIKFVRDGGWKALLPASLRGGAGDQGSKP